MTRLQIAPTEFVESAGVNHVSCRRGDFVNCRNPVIPGITDGALSGTAIDNEDTLAFSVLENIRPMVETVPLEQAVAAYARMMQGKARFRMVLTMNT